MTQTIKSVNLNNSLTVSAVVPLGITGITDPTLAIGQGAQLQNANSQLPTITLAWEGQITLSAGAYSLDLTAMPFGNLPNQNANGLKLRDLFIIADSANTNVITVAPGAVNGYTGWVGIAGLELNAKDQQHLGPLWSGIAVDGTHNTLDFASSMLAAKANLVLLFG